MSDLKKELQKRKIEGNYRKLPPQSSLIDFSSNDYLGLTSNYNLQAAVKRRLAECNPNIGSGAARLLSGNFSALEELESKIAQFHTAEEALLFSTGYLANLALLSAVAKRNDTIFYDEFSHASIKDGIRLGFAKSYSFRHNDLGDLEKKLKHAKGSVYVAVEALYSMDGDFAPLNDLASLCERYSLNLIVDEAHSAGIYGKEGEGRVKELGLEKKVFARIITFGKAFGAQGGAVAGSTELKEFMINFSRPFIYSTAISPYLVLLLEEAYKILPKMTEERKTLFQNINYFNEKAASGVKTEGPIKALLIRGNAAAKDKAGILQAKGFDVRAVLSPTVRKGHERLRICLHSFNSSEEINNLIKNIYD